MKYALLLLTIIFFLPVMSNGAIPIPSTSPSQEQEIKNVNEEIVNKKSVKKTSFFKRIAHKIHKRVADPKGSIAFNILSLVFGIGSFVAILAALLALSMTYIYVGLGLGLMAVAFGIVGLVQGGEGRGMGIAGIVIGGLSFFVHALVAAIVDAW